VTPTDARIADSVEAPDQEAKTGATMDMPNPVAKPTLTVEEVSSIIGCSRSSAYEAVRTGQLPSLRIGRRLLIPTARLREMLTGVADAAAAPPPREAAPPPTLTLTLDDVIIEALAEGVARGIERAKQRDPRVARVGGE
jgi:excisionase family DNA binding protein